MYILLTFVLLCFVASPVFALDDIPCPDLLRTEYRVNPLGIETETPRFTWQLHCPYNGYAQTAWQILVADTTENLTAAKGTLWDSGKVSSDNAVLIPYAGTPLQPRTPYWWCVRIWDEKDTPSAWSNTAHFSMGLPEEEEWNAQWIGYDAPGTEDFEAAGIAPLADAQWIGYPEGNPRSTAPRSTHLFRRIITLPDDAVIVNASLMITADDAAALWINEKVVGEGQPDIKNWKQVHYYLVDTLLQPGKNCIAVETKNGTGAAGLLAALRVTLRDGSVVDCLSDASWKISKCLPDNEWKQTDYSDTSWKQAAVLAGFGEAPWTESNLETARFKPVAQLRRSFTARGEIQRATLYVTALGIYEVHLNGKRVSDSYFRPGWTDFHKRVYYHTYDVSTLLRPGKENVIGALLAHGWYAGHLSNLPHPVYGTRPRFLAQLEIEYADGTTDTIASDENWRAAHGEIRGADLQMGEIRDQRKTLTGWEYPDYDDSAWVPVSITPPETIPQKIQAYPGAEVKQFETITAQNVSEPRPGIYVYDMGQNLVGWTRITVTGEADQLIRVRHTEMREEDGMLYTDALRSATATDIYHLADRTQTVLEPAFTFHGFRYVEIRGIDAPLPLEDVSAVVIGSEVPIVADFECSNPLLNQLVSNIRWGLRGNYFEIPTDCPQRDERLGWTGDAQFFMPTALYMADVGAFFNKWFVDLIEDSQLEDGSFAHVAPNINMGGGATAWGDAAIICPWLFYQFYGDTRVIEKHFDSMVRGMEFLAAKSENYTTEKIGFGDWLNLGGGAKPEVIFTAYYAHMAQLMAHMATLIGRDDEAVHFTDLHEKIRNAFVKMFVNDAGEILDSSQTGYALAFAFDLIPDKLREKAAQHFVEEIERFDWHLATGFIGTPRLLPALSAAGRDDIAWRLLMNTTFPSWLYQVTLGATTMWERWNGWT
ncbi:MAG: family 78 glycoside hydrolase catalytic domain, partial [Candidatus Hydrogenedentes bacterium]|nr:family 78 glycoside hydrolase catalytic domain [Candidatus Hydrogenedentota bacterium]